MSANTQPPVAATSRTAPTDAMRASSATVEPSQVDATTAIPARNRMSVSVATPTSSSRPRPPKIAGRIAASPKPTLARRRTSPISASAVPLPEERSQTSIPQHVAPSEIASDPSSRPVSPSWRRLASQRPMAPPAAAATSWTLSKSSAFAPPRQARIDPTITATAVALMTSRASSAPASARVWVRTKARARSGAVDGCGARSRCVCKRW